MRFKVLNSMIRDTGMGPTVLGCNWAEGSRLRFNRVGVSGFGPDECFHIADFGQCDASSRTPRAQGKSTKPRSFFSSCGSPALLAQPACWLFMYGLVSRWAQALGCRW